MLVRSQQHWFNLLLRRLLYWSTIALSLISNKLIIKSRLPEVGSDRTATINQKQTDPACTLTSAKAILSYLPLESGVSPAHIGPCLSLSPGRARDYHVMDIVHNKASARLRAVSLNLKPEPPGRNLKSALPFSLTHVTGDETPIMKESF